MAANGYQTPLQELARALIAEVKGLTVAQLKDVLRRQSLTVSGVKSELQIRLIADIEKSQHAGNRAALENFRRALRGPVDTSPAAYSSPYQTHTPISSASPTYPPSNSNFAMGGAAGIYRPPPATGPKFNNSPFYTIMRSLTSVIELKTRETTRDSVRTTVVLPQDVADLLQRDSKNRVMVFCSTSNSGYSDIAFPHQVELKCNGEEVKANLRGLKNKPGSTRPADITQFIRKKTPAYRNEVEMVYALTNKVRPFRMRILPAIRSLFPIRYLTRRSAYLQEKPVAQKFYMVVNYVVKRAVDELVRDIRNGRTFSKEAVLREMKKEAADPDIEVSSRVISLKCPLSYTRLQTPCRGTGCKHNQCFDAASYLQLQEQAPTWTCPQCNKPVPWHQLMLDQYVLDIVNNTSEDTEQVTVEPDGTWHLGDVKAQPTANKKRKLNATPDSDDEDLVLIEDSRPIANGNITQTLTPSSVRTPPLNGNGREDSVATSHTQRSASKRPRQEVIDLTLSDEDDDQDARPAVKHNSTNPSHSNGSVFGSTTMNSTLPAFRPRPPDQPQSINNNRYQFNLPPLHSTQSFNFTSSPFGGSGSGGYGSGSGSGDGIGSSNY